jgi:hypothetical protein
VKFMSGVLAHASFQRAAEVLSARGAERTGVRRAARRAYMFAVNKMKVDERSEAKR